jgi:hypothetical protein
MTQEQNKVSKCCGSEVTINYIGDNPNYPFNRCNKCGQPCEVITQPIQKEEEVECNFPIPCYMCLHRKEAGGNCNKTKKTTEKYTPTPSDTFIEEIGKIFYEMEEDTTKIDFDLNQRNIKRRNEIMALLKSSLQEQLNQFKEMITEYDEIYINEEVRQAINRMKWKLTDLLK